MTHHQAGCQESTKTFRSYLNIDCCSLEKGDTMPIVEGIERIQPDIGIYVSKMRKDETLKGHIWTDRIETLIGPLLVQAYQDGYTERRSVTALNDQGEQARISRFNPRLYDLAHAAGGIIWDQRYAQPVRQVVEQYLRQCYAEGLERGLEDRTVEADTQIP